MTEWHATEYARHSSLQQAMAAEQLGSLTLHGSERVLDVGCGNGKVTAEIAGRVPCGSVLGVDPSKNMVEFATANFGTKPNLTFEVGDARSLPYRGAFDLAVSFNALHWVPEQGDALRSMFLALKPGGRAVLRMVGESVRKSLEDVIEEVRKRPRWASHFGGYRQPYLHLTAEQYRAVAEQAGFRVLRIGVEDKSWDFQTREGFAGFAGATFVEWTRRIPEVDRPAFITDVLDAYRAEVSEGPHDANSFKFYQMGIELLRPPGS